jgi:hypothetical protein
VFDWAAVSAAARFLKGENMEFTYEQIRPTLNTFDQVLFRGADLVSDIVEIGSPIYSHCGTVIKTTQEMLLYLVEKNLLKQQVYAEMAKSGTEIYEREDGVLMVFESTLLNNLNNQKGVQLNLLSDRIAKYDGTVTIRRFIHDRTDEERKILSDFINSVYGLPYETDILELLGCILKFGPNIEDLTSWFCSELNAMSLQRENFLPPKPLADRYNPSDFAPGGLVDKNLLVGSFDDEIKILN